MAEVLPTDGELIALELDPFMVEFGAQARKASDHGGKIQHLVGPAAASLATLVQQAADPESQPFDLVIVDADKANLVEYFAMILDTPGMLSDSAIICVDTTPFKGQIPTRYVKYGQADRWSIPSGEEEIQALKKTLDDAADLEVHEVGQLLVIRRGAR